MKIEVVDDNEFIVYLMKNQINHINFDDKYKIEKYFQKIFKKLQTIYNIDIKGYYNITIYCDKYYGIVLEIKREDIDYFNYDNNMIDMRIQKIDNSFLYEVKNLNLLSMIRKNINIYHYREKIYIEIYKELPLHDMMMLMEYSILKFDIQRINFDVLKVDKIN